uniref:FERM domain-containing protein n=1 Tax=Mesocestoides corti TaxID=53468 RepID=A0A5K3FKW5_MESCO
MFLDPDVRLSTFEKKNFPTRLSFINSHSKHKYSVAKAASISENGVDEPLLFYFRVRFYVPNHCLRGRLVRHLYYEQLKLNSQTYRLLCSDEVYFQLAAFSIKMDLLAKRPSDYKFDESNFKLNNYFPRSMIDSYGKDYLYANIPNLIAPLSGQVREILQWRFIRLASESSSNFNLHLYRVSPLDVSTSSFRLTVSVSTLKHSSRLRRSHSGRSSLILPSGKGSFWLGIGPNGFEFHEEDDGKRIAHVSSLPWNKIYKISHKHQIWMFISPCWFA